MNNQIRKMYRAMDRKQIDRQVWFDFIATQDKAEVKEVVIHMINVEYRLKDFCKGHFFTTKIRSFINEYMYSDVKPYEVVKVISENCVEVRELDTNQIVFPKIFHVGGFSAHCADNHNQDYEYISVPSRPTIRLRKGKNGWGKGRFLMADAPYKHYDYNF